MSPERAKCRLPYIEREDIDTGGQDTIVNHIVRHCDSDVYLEVRESLPVHADGSIEEAVTRSWRVVCENGHVLTVQPGADHYPELPSMESMRLLLETEAT